MSNKDSDFIQSENLLNSRTVNSNEAASNNQYIQFNYSIREKDSSSVTLSKIILSDDSTNEYCLDIKASVLKNDYKIESWDITIRPNVNFTNAVFQTNERFPIKKNAIIINNNVAPPLNKTLRISAASLENLNKGKAISFTDGEVLIASINLHLESDIDIDSIGTKLLEITIGVNSDETILSRELSENNNRDIKSLRELNGEIYTLGENVRIISKKYLDVNGNGKIEAFSDGFMILRKMFGYVFVGDALTDKVLPDDSKRTTEEIHTYIQAGIDSGILDVTGNGKIEAFSDGLMILRKMFGDAFAGDALTDKVLPDDSKRTTEEIHKYIESLMNS